VEQVSTELFPELGIPYENGGLVALGVKGVVVIAIDGFGPLCDVVVVETMVARTDNGRLGDDSPVVATVVGIEEFPEGVTTFVSIAM
jgi:hypothetical protein